MQSIWCCPVCGESLILGARTWTCPNRHSFDIARSGYVNLLLASQKNSRDPGDNAGMVRSRKEFLSQGYYAPLSDAVNRMAIELRLPRYVVLDAGCGEGYFLRRLREALAARLPPQYVLCTGVDISKAAAEQAARQSRDLQVAVASTFHLPVPSGAIGLVLQIMAPGDLGEICRVLRPQGYFLRVTPGPRHLLGLKRLVYPETVLNGPDDQTLSGFQLVAEEFLQHELRLQSSEDISHLLAMTPYYWHVDQSAKDRVAVCKELVTPVEFCVRLYQRNRAGTAKPS